MASRSHGWFDEAKLLPSELQVRSGSARLRVSGPPYWWEGALILTSDRLFFLPHVYSPRIDEAAFWLFDMTGAAPAGRNRFKVSAHGRTATFHLTTSRPGPAGLIGQQAKAWLEAIAALRASARPRTAFDEPAARRAAG